MNNRRAVRPFAGLVGVTWLLATASGCTHRTASPEPKTGNETLAAATSPAPSAAPPETSAAPAETSAVTPSTVPTSSLDALPPPDTDTSAKARRSLVLTDSRGTVDPASNAIPSLPAKIDAPPHAGVDTAIKAVPSSIPVGTLTRSQLESPLRDRAHFDHCRIPLNTHGEIAAVVYNGAALGVDVKTSPNDRALNFCIERAVRQMTWVKELAVNKVKVAF